MKVEGRNVCQPSARIEIAHGVQGRDPIGSLDRRGAETPAVLYRHSQPFHQGARVLPETLLARYQRIAVMRIFHLELLEIARCAHIVMRSNNQASTFSPEKLFQGLNFLW